MAKQLQLVLTDRSDLMTGRDFGVVASSTWRLADLSTKHAFLKDGIGWGGMPLHMVEKDIASGSLVVVNVDDVPPSGFMLTMSAYRRNPAHRMRNRMTSRPIELPLRAGKNSRHLRIIFTDC